MLHIFRGLVELFRSNCESERTDKEDYLAGSSGIDAFMSGRSN
jgi:hypothetical protein